MADPTYSDPRLQFDTLLVANRGEIALRIMRTASRMGLRTVAVHSSADSEAPHVRAADIAVAIGPPPANESYLCIDKIIDAARRSGAQAIHPGYGFLSERAAFAQACEDAGLIFVGPSASSIAAMGDKAAAKQAMRAADVPVVPGYEGAQDDANLLAEAQRIGFPLMVKAAAGGGGKGMRLVQDLASLPQALAGARREAASAFGADHLLLERAIVRPRHVEIQILGDRHGHVIHLGERDCSVQRRHQKVIEEAPSPAVDARLRAAMGDAAVRAARSVDYVGAGTVEFLLAPSGEFYFLEMNTRLQVEHAVTEFITGLDLVEWQLRIARGERLCIRQEDVRLDGHAIEVRLYAEDPSRDYLPATGLVHVWEPPVGEAIRVDSGIRTGSEVTSFYDPMVAKIIAHGSDRQQALNRLARALEDTTLLGPATNRAMLLATLRSATFMAGQATTALLEETPAAPPVGIADVAAIAAWRYASMRATAARLAAGLDGWSSSGFLLSGQHLAIGDAQYLVWIEDRGSAVQLRVGDVCHEVTLDGAQPAVDGITTRLRGIELRPGHLLLALPARDLEVRDLHCLAPGGNTEAGAGDHLAPMHGKVIAVEAAVGNQVSIGQRLLAMEAMKMEHAITAQCEGIVQEIVNVGAQVSGGQLLVRIAPSLPQA